MKTVEQKLANNVANTKWRRKLRKEVISHYGNSCECCNESTNRFLTIDHINGGGNQHRKDIKSDGGWQFFSWIKKNDYPKDLRVLCMNCNWGRSHNDGICPHKEVINNDWEWEL